MEDLIAPIIFMLVVGGVAGYFAGHLVKRLSGAAIYIGILVFMALTLVYTGTFDINIDALTASISEVLGVVAPLGVVALVSSVPFVASFVAGLFIGYRRY
jgi:uncharacterized membrane protein (Fun14 family)